MITSAVAVFVRAIVPKDTIIVWGDPTRTDRKRLCWWAPPLLAGFALVLRLAQSMADRNVPMPFESVVVDTA